MNRMNLTAGHGGGSRSRRVQSAIAHALPYVLMAGVVVRVASWFGWLILANQITTVVFLVSWLLSGQHRLQDHLCAKYMDEAPADAPARAER